jgi:hypothetical protein
MQHGEVPNGGHQIKCNEDQVVQATPLFPCQMVEFPIKYLGMPLSVNPDQVNVGSKAGGTSRHRWQMIASAPGGYGHARRCPKLTARHMTRCVS